MSTPFGRDFATNDLLLSAATGLGPPQSRLEAEDIAISKKFVRKSSVTALSGIILSSFKMKGAILLQQSVAHCTPLLPALIPFLPTCSSYLRRTLAISVAGGSILVRLAPDSVRACPPIDIITGARHNYRGRRCRASGYARLTLWALLLLLMSPFPASGEGEFAFSTGAAGSGGPGTGPGGCVIAGAAISVTVGSGCSNNADGGPTTVVIGPTTRTAVGGTTNGGSNISGGHGSSSGGMGTLWGSCTGSATDGFSAGAASSGTTSGGQTTTLADAAYTTAASLYYSSIPVRTQLSAHFATTAAPPPSPSP